MVPSFIPDELLPTGDYKARAFVAGGYAACPSLATDCDVWVTVRDVEQARDELLAYLYGVQGPRPSNMEVEHRLGAPDDYGVRLPVKTLKVARIPARIEGRLLDIHLMVTTGDIDDVLDAFDISTHQCAITRRTELEGRVYRGSRWTPLDVEPQVLRWTPTTPDRLDKIRTRYNHYREGTPVGEIL